MSVEIVIKDSKIINQSRLLNNLNANREQDIHIEIDNTEIRDKAVVLDNLNDAQMENVLQALRDQMYILEKTTDEYKNIRKVLTEIDGSKSTAKETLKKYLPDLLTGTIANLISGLLLHGG